MSEATPNEGQGKRTKGGSTNGKEMPPPVSEPLTAGNTSRFRVENANYIEKVQEVLSTVLITPPPKDEFIRTCPDPAMRLITYTIRYNREHFLIEPSAFKEIQARVADFDRHASAVTL